MNPFDINLLISPALSIFICSLFIVFYTTRSPVLSLAFPAVKVALFISYFGFFFDGTYTFLDDWTYLERGGMLYSKDIHFLNFYKEWNYIKIVSIGEHISYYLFNSSSFYLFGEHYFSPVSLNIIITFIIASIGLSIVKREFNLNEKEGLIFFSFVLFHPDIMAWSQRCNLKDIFVLLLHTSMLNGISLISHKRNIPGLIAIFATSSVLYFTRFYVPLIFILVLIFTTILTKSRKKVGMPLVIALILLFLSEKYLGISIFQNAIERVDDNLSNLIYGFIRIIFTPIPFHTEESYRFLNFPALFNWIMFPSAFVGLISCYKKKTFFSVFVCLYFLCFLVLYASYVDLQGPRHKVQLDFALALFQYLGWQIIYHSCSKIIIKKSLTN